MLPSLVHKPTLLAGTWGAGWVLVTRVRTPSAVPHGHPASQHRGGSESAPLTRKEHELRRSVLRRQWRNRGLLARTGAPVSAACTCGQSEGMWVCGSLGGMSSCPGTGLQELRGPCLAISLHYSRSIHASLSVNGQLGIKICPSASPPLTELTPLHLNKRQLAPW